MTPQISPQLTVVKPVTVDSDLLQRAIDVIADEMSAGIEALARRIDAELAKARQAQKATAALLDDAQRRLLAMEDECQRRLAAAEGRVADLERQLAETIADLERQLAELRQAIVAEVAFRQQLDPAAWMAKLVEAVRELPTPQVHVENHVENNLPTTEENKEITYNDAGYPVGIKVTRTPK